MSNPTTSLPPGFRFHPTDVELILHYMRNQGASTPCPVSIIAEVDIYKFHPWELPGKAVFGDHEWYFFSPRDRKYPNGVRPNRSAASGYWKATGTNKLIHTGTEKELIGVKKTLVFYKGRPPKGLKTNWIMHEYRLADAQSSSTSYKSMKPIDSTSMKLDDWVLCRIYKKSSHSWSQSVINGEQEEWCDDDCEIPSPQKRQQESTKEMPRSSSLLDFLEEYSRLSQLYDYLPEMPWLDDGSPMGNSSARQPLISDRSNSSSGINYLVQQLSKAGSPALIARSYMKRRWTSEGESTELLTPSKKLHDSDNFTGSDKELGNPHCSMMSQSMFNQQLLLNSNLELQ